MANDSRRKDTPPPTETTRLVQRTTVALAQPDLGLVAGVPPLAILPQPVDLLRTDDLLFLRCSFVNLTWNASQAGAPPSLVRNTKNRPAFLVVTLPPQHVIERAFFQTAAGALPGATNPPGKPDPDAGRGGGPLEVPPVFASLAARSRLVFKVTDQQIVYTVEGILQAMATLELVVAPHAVPPPPPLILRPWRDLVSSGQLNLAALTRAAAAGQGKRAQALPADEVAANAVALARVNRTAVSLERRFGQETALQAVAAVRVGELIDVSKVIGVGVLTQPPPLPAAPGANETSIELPWRLVVSPNGRAAWAHSLQAVGHDARVELWHTRLGLRATARDGTPLVDEIPTYYRTIRAIWSRDFDETGHPFHSPPVLVDFPTQDPADNPPLNVRTSLNSRDRMMLVHETSNFHLTRQRADWAPPAVPVEQMMLSALGGWLKSRVEFPTLPDGPLTIEEWKHRAGMGRDHEVKVVYAGFLLPFGHKVSLVKLTQRKIARGPNGPVAYLFQRMFIVVREPEKQFTAATVLNGDTRADLAMPLKTVRILTAVTPDLDNPMLHSLSSNGFLFVPYVGGTPFPFKLVAVDVEGTMVEFRAPLCFMDRGLNDASFTDPGQPGLARSVAAYNGDAQTAERRMPLEGQRLAFAGSRKPDDTMLATNALTFDVAVLPNAASVPQDDPRFLPILRNAEAVVPAMSALAGQATSVTLRYPQAYRQRGFTDNTAEVFLELVTKSPMEFAGQGDRSGGFVTPSLNVSALSRLTGPIGGDPADAIGAPGSPGTFDPAKFFDGVKAKLFGVVKLTDLLKAFGFDPSKVPAFIAQSLDAATTLIDNARRLLAAAQQVEAQAGAAATALRTALQTFVTDVGTLTANPANPSDLSGDLTAVKGALGGFISAVNGLEALPRPQRVQVVGIAQRIQEQVGDAAGAAALLQQLARGELLPDVVTARLDWSTDIPRWPSGSVDDAILSPVDASHHPIEAATLSLAVEVQAPTKPGRNPTALVSCSISPVDLRLIGPATFLILHFEKLEFSIEPGRKPDVNVAFRDPDGIEFAGPLSFVSTLKDMIPFNGFSDPPSLDVTAEGVKAVFDLSIPSLGVGVMSLENIALGAHFSVPFIDESLEVGFNFCTRENPFRLTVMLFGGGGFFGITLTPDGVRILEASFEFGAEISIDLGVASGGVSVMAGIYFKLEMVGGNTDATLTGYFRLRGEVDVLGLISASIELYLELTYETATGKAVGRATLTIEISIFFLSFSVSISCEKKFAGANGDPTFIDQMGLPAGAPPGTVRPWDLYCRAFA